MKFRVDIWHNILWSKYKGAVFSELHRQCVCRGIDAHFFQIADTENDRRGLATVDLGYHKYPFELIAKGSYQDIPLLYLIATVLWKTFLSPADIVVLAGYHRIEYWAQLIAARLSGKRVMVFCDSTYLDHQRNNFKDHLKRFFFSNCAGFFCYGERSREYLKTYGVPSEKIIVRCQTAALPRGYNREQALEKRLASLREGLAPVILYVGRLSPEKNLLLLLKAFRKLVDETPAFCLKLIGQGPDRKELEQSVVRLGLGGKVIFAGGMSGEALFDEYARATCLVLPSLSEPWGLVVNEALSYGCPVVVSDNCGCVPELVIEGKTGYRFSTIDVSSLTKALAQAVSPTMSTPDVTYACFEAVAKFTPRNAASAIISGLLKSTS